MAIINGSSGDDFLHGTPSDDTINAFAGNDLVNADQGNDVVDGGDGHDNLRGDEGDDSLYGGTGDDYLRGGLGNDLIDGGAGWDRVAFFTAPHGIIVDLRIQGAQQDTGMGLDTLVGIEHASGTPYADTIYGNDDVNWLWGEGGTDTISAFGGNDLVEVGPGDVTADGGLGNDTFSMWDNGNAASPGVSLSLALQGSSQTTAIGNILITGFENLSGSEGNDALTGDAGSNVLAGDQGSDTLSGGGGDDALYGDGRVIIDNHGAGTSGPITTYQDVDLAFPPLPGAPVDGNDVLEGGLGDDMLYGGGGSDTASYEHAAGAVQVFLGASTGVSSGADGDDTLFSIENAIGSAFDDQLVGNGGANVLSGGAGHDYLRGDAGNDSLNGGDGDDYLRGGAGDDLIDGGAGWDRAAFRDALSGVHVDLNIQGVAQNTLQGFDTLIGIEHASGSQFDDVLTGNAGDNWLWGEGGNDNITAGAGNDLVEVWAGNVTAAGGSGIDTFSVWESGLAPASPVAVSLLLQGGAQATGIGSMTLTGFENLSGSSANDTLTGDAAANVLAGDQGNDVLSGGDGDDLLYGDGRIAVDHHGAGTSGPIVTYADVVAAFPGDPTLVAGNDTLIGGKGNDTLVGGGGDDTLTGGLGKDVFLFGPASGDDHITDFAKQDLISLQGIGGVDDFSDLTIVNVGGSAVISWGTTDSITLDGYKASKLSAVDFSFGASAPASAFAAAGVNAHGHHGIEAPPADGWMP
ncbi:MAG TPA: calcium-binding protein [Allosphingosinicella sp.]|nr:calcium-binding protein [Allosphingosinicella sp.]